MSTGERSVNPIPRQPPRETYGLSYSQRGAWLREQLYPGLLSYNSIRVLDLAGPLAADRLREALQALVDRYDVLRARFATEGNDPVQWFSPLTIDLPLVDLSTLRPGEQSAEAQRQIGEILAVRFDLATGPLCRFCLLRLTSGRHLLLLCLHHLVVDGVSYGQIVREVLASYAGHPLPPPRLQFQDFAAWQRERVESGDLATSRRYWTERLGCRAPVPALPT